MERNSKEFRMALMHSPELLADSSIRNIPWEQIELGARIGMGASGAVSKARWHKPSGEAVDVAVKELHHVEALIEMGDGEDILQDFLAEIKLMRSVRSTRPGVL